MQDFDSRIGWTRGGLILSAILCVVLGALCLAVPDIMPHALHKPILPDGLTSGGIIAAIIIFIVGVVELAAYKKLGGSRNVGGFLVLTGVFSIFIALAIITDPIFGTLSYEWVCAVMFGLWGALAFLEGISSARVIHYKGWPLEALMGLVMVGCAVGVLLDSSQSNIMAGIALFAAAIDLVAIPFLGKGIKVAAAA